MKDIWVKFSEQAHLDYKKLQKQVSTEMSDGKSNSFNMQLLKSIEHATQNLKLNPQFGIHVPRKYIPRIAVERYGTDRLWKVDLVGYWRLLYTIIGDEIKIITFILEFIDHAKYDKIFGYRKK